MKIERVDTLRKQPAVMYGKLFVSVTCRGDKKGFYIFCFLSCLFFFKVKIIWKQNEVVFNIGICGHGGPAVHIQMWQLCLFHPGPRALLPTARPTSLTP